MTQKILILHGPNLNLLGEREPEIYGHYTLQDINDVLESLSEDQGYSPLFYQSNHEGALIDCLHEHRKIVRGVVFNPGAYTHTSVALRDAISAIRIPVVEVHLTDITKREDFRKVSIIKGVCAATFMGEGIESYKKALNHLIQILKANP
jgi:3-dehydroquinate dehydratase-2